VAAGRVWVGAGAERAVGRDGAERPLDLDWRAIVIVWWECGVWVGVGVSVAQMNRFDEWCCCGERVV
jgi:hypothetical protein